jgi:hypothetical protein
MVDEKIFAQIMGIDDLLNIVLDFLTRGIELIPVWILRPCKLSEFSLLF